jgi:hypothetical protein
MRSQSPERRCVSQTCPLPGYRNITGIHMSTGLVSGVVVVQAPGVQSGTVKFQSNWKSEDAFALPHAIPLRHGEFAQAAQGVATLRWLIAAAQRPAPALANGPTELLTKLGQLRDAGVISPAEFEAKKADILRRM